MKRFLPTLALALMAAVGRTGDAPAHRDFMTAVANAPDILAARLRMQAATIRQEAAGRIPDPQLEGGYGQKQTPDKESPVWEVSLRQPLPRAGERSADQQRAHAAADIAKAEYLQRAGEIAANAAMQLADAETAGHHLAIAAQLLIRMNQILAAVDARISAGQGRSTERLALQTRIADLRLAAARDEQRTWDAERAARATLGLPTAAPLPSYFAPSAADIVADESATVQMPAARSREAASMESMARASQWPMSAVGMRYQRSEMDDGNNEDMLGVALMTEIPWRSRRYARADMAAARAEQSASQADAVAARQAIDELLSRAERAELLANTARKLAAETGARLDAEYAALLARAGATGSDAEQPLLLLLDILEKQADIDIETATAEGDARVARAALWRHAPASMFTLEGDAP